jgi:hypothetical protein
MEEKDIVEENKKMEEEKKKEDIDYIAEIIKYIKSTQKKKNFSHSDLELINNEIYSTIFQDVILDHGNAKYQSNIDISNYISNLDKTRIKSPEEYYDDFMNAPIYLKNGTFRYFAPELFVSKKTFEEKQNRKINPLQTEEHIVAPINPLYVDTQDECNFNINTPLNELISLTYLKHMYNRPLLDSCRSLIKFKIIHENEILNKEDIFFLSKIDNYLYRIYLEKHNLFVGGIKQHNKKTKRNKKRNKKTKTKRNKKTKNK